MLANPLPGPLADMIRQTTRVIRKSLFESAATDRTGRLARMLRDNPVDRGVTPRGHAETCCRGSKDAIRALRYNTKIRKKAGIYLTGSG